MPALRRPALSVPAAALALACVSCSDLAAPGRTILDVAFGRGRFVAVGLGGTVSVSPDGTA